ncbi:SigB/SigF/SigG family RNA polymerase sigma factor [Actinoplanes sp. NPDC026623]|uniref:SigB/SigF/SigG family RNA polymerase sigma factor n=1 Tax=Actinoplanes sp. NPDC026623 TaxID=3155610 RepID=UPI003404C2A8
MSAPRSSRELEDLDAAAVAYASRATATSATNATQERERFTRECLPLARRLAGRLRDRGEPLDDLEQVARLGLVKAVDRYDPERGSFTAYAVSTISGELKRHFRDTTWAVHVPRPIRELLLEVRHARTQLTGELHRAPTLAELAAHVGVTENEITETLIAGGGYSLVSLDASPIADHDTTAHTLADRLGVGDTDLEMVDDKVTVARLLMRLPDRERRMLAMRFYGNQTQTEIAAELGISQMHVSRLLNRALSWLRQAMLTDEPPLWNTTDTHELHLSMKHADRTLTVRVQGEIDRDSAPRLRDCLRHAVATAGTDRMVVGLAGVALIDAAGVTTLADAASAASVAGIDLTLTGAGPHVRQTLELCGLATLTGD